MPITPLAVDRWMKTCRAEERPGAERELTVNARKLVQNSLPTRPCIEASAFAPTPKPPAPSVPPCAPLPTLLTPSVSPRAPFPKALPPMTPVSRHDLACSAAPAPLKDPPDDSCIARYESRDPVTGRVWG